MANEIEKPSLLFEVAIRESDGALVRVAEMDGEPRARLFTDTLKDAGVDAIYYKPRVDL